MFSANTSQVDAGGGAIYIEDVFSTYLYTGNGFYPSGGGQTIVNNIDLSGKGGLIWIKARSTGTSHGLYDTARGINQMLGSNNTNQQYTDNAMVSANSNGFTLGAESSGWTRINSNGQTYASWTFREQAKFFDVVTWSGTGSVQNIAHNLGSVPGCIIVKRTDTATNWVVYHRSLNTTAGGLIALNLTFGELTDVNAFNSTVPTSTVFTVGSASSTNGSGGTFVAYVFAHNAGGFGTSGSDNVISCGSFTTDGSGNATVNLGYEPQWVLWKKSDVPVDAYSNWTINDNMRGFTVDQGSQDLYPNRSDAEAGTGSGFGCSPTSTGFKVIHQASKTYIYIAIRRGPMAVPTVGTSVYQGTTRTGTGASASISGLNFPPDAVLTRNRDSNGSSRYAFYDKLRGPTIYLDTAATDSEFTNAQSLTSFNQTGESFGTAAISNYSGDPYINWQFRRAPSFFDEVCFTDDGTGTQAVKHNLGVTPELQIVKVRSNAQNWPVYITSGTLSLKLNLTDAAGSQSLSPTSTQFTAPGYPAGWTVVSYLFATCPGVSKVGSYTGNGTTQTINCGFTGGARFVLIKRTDSTGDWYTYDTARGMTVLTDPYLLLNSSSAESATLGSVTTVSTGFAVNASILAAINTNAASYIFLAIA